MDETGSETTDSGIVKAGSGATPATQVQPGSTLGWTKLASSTFSDGAAPAMPSPEDSARAIAAGRDDPAGGFKGPKTDQPFAEIENTAHPNSAYLAGVKVPEKMGLKIGEEGTAVGAADMKVLPPAGVVNLIYPADGTAPVADTSYGHVDYDPMADENNRAGILGQAHPDFGIPAPDPKDEPTK